MPRVVLIGQLFGIMGVLLAVPILTALVVLVQELWVRPREDAAAGGPPGASGGSRRTHGASDGRRVGALTAS